MEALFSIFMISFGQMKNVAIVSLLLVLHTLFSCTSIPLYRII